LLDLPSGRSKHSQEFSRSVLGTSRQAAAPNELRRNAFTASQQSIAVSGKPGFVCLQASDYPNEAPSNRECDRTNGEHLANVIFVYDDGSKDDPRPAAF
jgi:hypothetical protein